MISVVWGGWGGLTPKFLEGGVLDILGEIFIFYALDIINATLGCISFHHAWLGLQARKCSTLLVNTVCTLKCQVKGNQKKKTPYPCGVNARHVG